MSQSTIEEPPVSENSGKMYINPEATRLMIEDITGFKFEAENTEDLINVSKQEDARKA